MKKVLFLAAASLLCIALFAGCAAKKDSVVLSDVHDEADKQVAEDFSEAFEDSFDECYVSFEDGDFFDLPVEKYGDEITLPESENTDAVGEFLGWIGNGHIYQPGDTVAAEEYLSFSAFRNDPEYGTLLALDSVRGEHMIACSEEEIEIYSPYENYDSSDQECFFDHWVDESGNSYEAGECVTVEKGKVLILNAVYSDDLSAAYRVHVDYNTGDDFFTEEYVRYVKKGSSIPLWVILEPAGLKFDGWYDAPNGGSLLANEEDLFTPSSDIDLYGHWSEKQD